MISKGKKAAIHIAAGQLGLSGDAYRDELEKAVGVRSSLKLTNRTYDKAMAHFRALGAVPTRSKYYRIIENLSPADRQIMKKINAIRLDMGLSWRYVDSIAQSVAKVDAVQWAKGDALHSVLKALVIHQKRQLKNKKSAKEA